MRKFVFVSQDDKLPIVTGQGNKSWNAAAKNGIYVLSSQKEGHDLVAYDMTERGDYIKDITDRAEIIKACEDYCHSAEYYYFYGARRYAIVENGIVSAPHDFPSVLHLATAGYAFCAKEEATVSAYDITDWEATAPLLSVTEYGHLQLLKRIAPLPIYLKRSPS